MPDEVGKYLEELHQHIGGEDASDLRKAVSSYESDGDHEVLLDRLRDSALRFESSHPELSAVVARVIDSLTAAGI